MFALQNCGTDIDEDIEISLKIPKNSFESLDNFPDLDNREKGYLLNDCEMSELFGIRSTAEYLDYNSSLVYTKRFSPYISSPQTFPYFSKDYSDDFERELEEVFCYSCFEEGEDCIIKLKFDYIKHNTIVAFPTVLFIKDNLDTIKYTITSKNIPKIVSAEIKIIKEDKEKT